MKVKEESEKVGLKLNIQQTKIMASGPITSCEIDGETVETVSDFIFLSSSITVDGDCSHTNLDSIFKSRNLTLLTKVRLWFSSNHVWMWELDCEEGWALKNWCFWTVMLEKTLEIPLDFQEIQPVHPKGDQSWVFIGRTDVEVETPVLWPPDAKSWLIWKDPKAGKDWRWEKEMKEDEMVG